jgi:choline dehydrogenase-like flavoprotein
MPVGNIFLIPHARYNWKHTLSGNAQIGGRSINFPRGKLMGGCSAINGGVYIRGQREDYDAWARAGNAGWAYSDVLPAFTAVENYAGADKPWHGKGGELDVQKPRSFNPITHAIIAAAQQAGHQRNDDFAGERQAGFGPYDLNQRRGTRLSSARAFLNPVLKRPNLTVLSETLARRILFDRGAMARDRAGGRAAQAARREVVLCGGAINSPQLLMLSGSARRSTCARRGSMPSDPPGVGAHLQDHPTVHVSMENPARNPMRSRRAPMAVSCSALCAICCAAMACWPAMSRNAAVFCTDGSGRPDIQITFLVGLKANARVIPSEHGYMALIQLLRPKSQGSVRLAAAIPRDKPVIDPNFFADPYDMRTLIAGFREARRIFAQPALAAMTGAEIEPGACAERCRDRRRAAQDRQHRLSPHRHLQDGARQRPDGGGRCAAAGARRVGAARGRCLGDARDHQRQHQRPHHDDRPARAAFILEDAARSNIAA